LTEKVVKMSEKITNLLGLDVAGVDLLFKGDSFVLCEVNSSPGLKIEKYCDVNIAGAIAEHVAKILSQPNILNAS